MTSFVDLAGATGPDAPFTETVATALDRNLFAAMEGDSTAIAAGVRLSNTAIADGAISGRALAGGFATTSSTQLFDYLAIKGSRSFQSSSNDQTTQESFIAKAWRIQNQTDCKSNRISVIKFFFLWFKYQWNLDYSDSKHKRHNATGS